MTGRRRWFRLRGVERDVDDEIALYFEEAVRDLEAAGMTPSAAREEAGRRFGDELHYRRALMEIDRSAAARRRWTARAESVRYGTSSGMPCAVCCVRRPCPWVLCSRSRWV